MIKSLLFHRKTSSIIHLHLIVDTPGQQFFERELLSMQPVCMRVTFHPFQDVCHVPNVEFLNTFNFSLSAHYSGHAGYCRLHMPKWFAQHHPNIPTLMAIETDQIFMDDVAGLYAEYEEFGDQNDAIVGMPEMYKPWRDGRVTVEKDPSPKLYDPQKIMDDMTSGGGDGGSGGSGDGSGDGSGGSSDGGGGGSSRRESERGLGAGARGTPGEERGSRRSSTTTNYHGNGYIGGIIMFNLQKIKKMANIDPQTPGNTSHPIYNTFEKLYYESLHDFLMIERETDPEWNPQLNDQDIFNAMFTMRPELVHTIDCKWQLQFHAFQEHRRLCDGQSFFNKYDHSCPDSIKSNMFLCKKSPGIVHFMAQSYMTKTSGPSYVSDGFFFSVLVCVRALNLPYVFFICNVCIYHYYMTCMMYIF